MFRARFALALGHTCMYKWMFRRVAPRNFLEGVVFRLRCSWNRFIGRRELWCIEHSLQAGSESRGGLQLGNWRLGLGLDLASHSGPDGAVVDGAIFPAAGKGSQVRMLGIKLGFGLVVEGLVTLGLRRLQLAQFGFCFLLPGFGVCLGLPEHLLFA